MVAPVDLGQQREGLRLRPGGDLHVELPVARVGARRDAHPAPVELAVGHHDVVPPTLELPPVHADVEVARPVPGDGEPEAEEVPPPAEGPGEPLGPPDHLPPEPRLRDVREVPRPLLPALPVRHLPHVDGVDAVREQVADGRGDLVREPEGLDEVGAGAGGHHPQDGVVGHQPVALDHPVHDLVDRPVTPDGHEEPVPLLEGPSGQARGLTRALGLQDAVVEAPRLDASLQLRHLAADVAAAGARVDDQGQAAERATHGAGAYRGSGCPRGPRPASGPGAPPAPPDQAPPP